MLPAITQERKDQIVREHEIVARRIICSHLDAIHAGRLEEAVSLEELWFGTREMILGLVR